MLIKTQNYLIILVSIKNILNFNLQKFFSELFIKYNDFITLKINESCKMYYYILLY